MSTNPEGTKVPKITALNMNEIHSNSSANIDISTPTPNIETPDITTIGTATQNNITYFNPNNATQRTEVGYEFEEMNTFAHKFFGEKTHRILHKITLNKYMYIYFLFWIIISMVIVSIAEFGTRNRGKEQGTYATIYFKMYCLLLGIIPGLSFQILWLLCLNISAAKTILRSFEFWFKMYYTLQFIVAFNVHAYHFNKWYRGFWALMGSLIALLWSIIVGTLDAVNISKRSQILACFAFGLVCMSYAVWYTFIDGEVWTLKISEDVSISVNTLIADGAKLITIFSFKQGITTKIRQHKCVLIKYIPYMRYT